MFESVVSRSSILGLMVLACGARPGSPSPDESLPPPVVIAPKSLSVDSSRCDTMGTDHDAFYKRGVGLIDRYIIVQNRAPAQSDRRTRELLVGIACLDRALELAPRNWAAFWLRGKAYQALGDHERSADSFRSAYRIQPQNPDVGRELALEQMELGELRDALSVGEALVLASPNDAGLKANLALSLLLVGQVQRARDTIDDAIRLDPNDAVSRELKRRIEEVANGLRRQPHSLKEFQQ